jgi:hypothetical protein
MEYEFAVVFAIDRCHESISEIVELLGAAGLTDATLGIGRPGHVAFQFSREAPSADIAAHTAIAAIGSVIPMAKLVELRPLRQGRWLYWIADAFGSKEFDSESGTASTVSGRSDYASLGKETDFIKRSIHHTKLRRVSRNLNADEVVLNNPQGLCQALDIIQRNTYYSALDLANVRSMEASHLGQFLLR